MSLGQERGPRRAVASPPRSVWDTEGGLGWDKAEAPSNSLPVLLPAPQLWSGLRFTVPHLRDTKKTIQFDFQILR